MRKTKKSRIGPFTLFGIVLGGLLVQTVSPPANAQSPDTTILKAQNTLKEIGVLLDSILGRQAARSRSGNSPKESGADDARDWKSLFDGKSLGDWKRTDFAGGGEVQVVKSFRSGSPAIVVRFGEPMSGFNWTKDVPKTNYEISLEAMRIDGGDFLCGLTFPVGDSFASLIVGGWGGGVVGISSIDDRDASENETTKYMGFPKDRWYQIRLRITPAKLQAWIDNKNVVDQIITGHRISLRPGEISHSIPLGIATYRTSAAFRKIRMRPVAAKLTQAPQIARTQATD
jgi:hypothetical protein